MNKIFRNVIIIAVVCLCMAGSINIFANASGNVRNRMFHFVKKPGTSYTDPEFKDDGTGSYIIVSDGLSTVDVTVMGTNGTNATKYACSKEKTLQRLVEYTFNNKVHSNNYKYAALRMRNAASPGSGYWSPDSSKTYTPIG